MTTQTAANSINVNTIVTRSNSANAKMELFLVYFTLIDILFLPYFPFIVMPMSLPVVAYYIITKKINIKIDNEMLIFIMFSFFVMISAIISILHSPQSLSGINIWSENIKRALQLLTSFLYFFAFKNLIHTHYPLIKKLLFIFILFYILLGLICFLDVGLYFKYLNLLGIRNPFVKDWFLEQDFELFRYSYIFVDPNNAAYCFQMCSFFLLTNFKNSLTEKLVIIVCVIFSIFLSMSTGSVISLILFGFAYFLSFIKFESKLSVNKILLFVSEIILIIFLLTFVNNYIEDHYQLIKDYSIERITSNDDGGRINKYIYMFSNSLPSIVGEGYIIIRDDKLFRPHSDHLRILYSYGFVAYIILIWFFFRKLILNRKYLFLIPGLLAFTANSLIDEQKILAVFLLLTIANNFEFKDNLKNNKPIKGE